MEVLNIEEQKELFLPDNFIMPDEIFDNQFNCMDWFINDNYRARWIVYTLLNCDISDAINKSFQNYNNYKNLKTLNSEKVMKIVDDNSLDWLEDDYWYLERWIETISEITNKLYITRYVDCYKEYDSRMLIIEIDKEDKQ